MDNKELLATAREAMDLAYVPYSKFRVGAALLTRDGRVFKGCNIENASYGLCNCGERTAFFSAIASGVRPGDFKALAVIGDTEKPISPCGACRQVIIELGGPELTVILGNLKGDVKEMSASELLPFAFVEVEA